MSSLYKTNQKHLLCKRRKGKVWLEATTEEQKFQTPWSIYKWKLRKTARNKHRVCRKLGRRGKFHRKELTRETTLINRLSAQVQRECNTSPNIPCHKKWLLGFTYSPFLMCVAVHGKMEVNADLDSSGDKMVERVKNVVFCLFLFFFPLWLS